MEDMLCWDVTPSGGRSTEGWVKYDLESGVTDTQWLNNAVRRRRRREGRRPDRQACQYH